MEYVRALEESECRYFLYENNYSIHKDIKAEISRQLGVEPIMINSALVSAQSRKRCYWTNIPNITQPADKGILLKDIIESSVAWLGKSYCLCASYSKAAINDCFRTRGQKSVMVAEPLACAVRSRYISSGNRSTRCDGGTYPAVEVRKDGKANCMTTVTKDSMVLQPIRIGDIGSSAQGHRVYSVKGKSITLSANGSGQGGSTGLYKIDLPDGDYIIRKLSPIECERLQTLPNNYTAGISNTQRV